MNELFQSKRFKPYICNMTIVLFVYGLMLHKTYRSDHIWAAVQNNSDSSNIWSGILQCILGGRVGNILINFISGIFGKFGVNKLNSQYVIQLFFFLIIVIVISEIYIMFSELFEIESFSLVVDGIIVIGFVNPIFVELLSWIGFEHGIAIALSGWIAVRLFNKKHYLCAFLALLLAISIYQSYYAPFLIYSVTYLFISDDMNFRHESIIKYFIAVSITGSACFFCLLLTKITSAVTKVSEVKSTSVAGNSGIAVKIISIIEWIYMIVVHTYGMMPSFFLICIIILSFSIVFYYYRKMNKTFRVVFNSVLICLFLLLVPFAITLAMSSVGLETRVMASYFMSISMIFLIIFSLLKKSIFFEKCKMKFEAILFFLIIVDIFCTETVILDFFISNALDIAEVRQINEIIEQYENENNIMVTKIAVRIIPDSKGAKVYEEYFHLNYIGYVFLDKMDHDSWCTVELVNYICGEDYKKEQMSDAKYNEYFGELNAPDTFNPKEQLKFDGDTLYWAIE